MKSRSEMLERMEAYARQTLERKWAEAPRNESDVFEITNLEYIAIMKMVDGEVVFIFQPR